MLIISNGAIQSAVFLLNNGHEKDPKDNLGRSLLHYAVSYNQKISILFLLEVLNLDSNCFDKKGDTPLSLAVQSSNFEVIELLIINGSLPTKRNHQNLDVFDTAIEMKRHDLLSDMFTAFERFNCLKSNSKLIPRVGNVILIIFPYLLLSFIFLIAGSTESSPFAEIVTINLFTSMSTYFVLRIVKIKRITHSNLIFHFMIASIVLVSLASALTRTFSFECI